MSKKRILCFGDSLTYGQVPGTLGVDIERYDESIRWTSKLQTKLQSDYAVIEEGLPSRTIDLEDPRPGKSGRNASIYLSPCLESHLPLDFIVLWLGTNDTKDMFDKSAAAIASSMDQLLTQLIKLLRGRKSSAKIILVTPLLLDPTNTFLQQFYQEHPYAHALVKLQALPALYEEVANKHHIEFLNLQPLVKVPDTADGIHLSPEQNEEVASIIFTKIKDVQRNS